MSKLFSTLNPPSFNKNNGRTRTWASRCT